MPGRGCCKGEAAPGTAGNLERSEGVPAGVGVHGFDATDGEGIPCGSRPLHPVGTTPELTTRARPAAIACGIPVGWDPSSGRGSPGRSPVRSTCCWTYRACPIAALYCDGDSSPRIHCASPPRNPPTPMPPMPPSPATGLRRRSAAEERQSNRDERHDQLPPPRDVRHLARAARECDRCGHKRPRSHAHTGSPCARACRSASSIGSASSCCCSPCTRRRSAISALFRRR